MCIRDSHTFVERSFILRAVRWCWRTAGRIVRWAIDLCKKFWHFIGRGQKGFWRNLWRKLFQDYKTRNVLLILLVYSAVLAVLGMMFGVMIDYGTALFVCLLGVLWFCLLYTSVCDPSCGIRAGPGFCFSALREANGAYLQIIRKS